MNAEPRSIVCIACPMLCEDVVVDADSRAVDRACPFGERAILRVLDSRADRAASPATIDGEPAARSAAIDAAVERLRAARRPLVTGLAAAPLEAQSAAADLAESLHAAFDTGFRDGCLAAGPTIARVGEVTAAWEELRDRADLVILWFVEPAATHPRFAERFLAPPPAEGARSLLTVGIAPPALPEALLGRHIAAMPTEAVALARAVEASAAETDPDAATATGPDDPRVEAILAAIRKASCVAVVTGDDDPVGIRPWSVARLVRVLAHRRPAFAVPLAAGVGAGGGNAAGAAAIATWRYGAAAAIDRADDRAASFRPRESDGASLLQRGESDLVVVGGGLSAVMRRRLAEAAASRRVDVVWIGDDPDDVVAGGGRRVFIRAANPLFEASGGMLREDGRLVSLRPILPEAPAGAMPTIAEVFAGIVARLRGDPSRAGAEAVR